MDVSLVQYDEPSAEDLAMYAEMGRIIAKYEAQVDALRALYNDEVGTVVIRFAQVDGLITGQEHEALYEFLTGWQ